MELITVEYLDSLAEKNYSEYGFSTLSIDQQVDLINQLVTHKRASITNKIHHIDYQLFIKDVCNNFSLSAKVMLSENRSNEYTIVRDAIAFIMSDRSNYPNEYIGVVLKRHRTSIVHSIKRTVNAIDLYNRKNIDSNGIIAAIDKCSIIYDKYVK